MLREGGVATFASHSESAKDTMQFKTAFAILVYFISVVAGQDTSLGAVTRAFDAANIPSDLQVSFDPKVLLDVTFPEPSGHPTTLHAGIPLPRNATVGPPTFSIRSRSPFFFRGPFVVAAVDPDAPPTRAEIRHFLGGNFHLIFSLHESQELVNSTAAISKFQQPTPPAGDSPHRYIFLLFKQPPGFNHQTLINSTSSIANFNISQFAAAVGLGNPIGGTFMRVGPDSAVA